MKNEIDSQALIAQLSASLYEYLVRNAGANKLALWQDTTYSQSADAEFKRIAAEVTHLSRFQTRLIENIVKRVAADTVLDFFQVLNGSLDIGLEGEFSLKYNRIDVGGPLQDALYQICEGEASS
jgi:hypothetical protein